jgi:hypothetical protein
MLLLLMYPAAGLRRAVPPVVLRRLRRYLRQPRRLTPGTRRLATLLPHFAWLIISKPAVTWMISTRMKS